MSNIVTLNPDNFKLTKDAYLGGLLQLSENNPLVENSSNKLTEYLNNFRQESANQVVKLNIPTTKEEEWRFTDLSSLQKQDFHLAKPSTLDSIDIKQFSLPEAENCCLVFVNGYYSSELSNLSDLPQGIYVGNLSNLDTQKADKITQYLGKNQNENEVFTTLNSAGISDIAVIWVEANTEIKTPIQFLHLTARGDFASLAQPRMLIVTEANSSINLLEYYGAVTAGCSDGVRQNHYFNNVVTEICLGENSQVNHTRIQRESGDGFQIAKTVVNQARDSRYTINEVSLGGKLYRHNLEINQEGEQTETNLYGLTMLQGKQLGDTHSQVNLTQPHGTVNQLHKYIIDNSAQGVFNGKINVPKLAQLTNASQLNRNLLLSPKARINTKPELEITADNVKCAHGATVSQLEADEIFYLRSRGLNEYDATHLLIDAFAAEILQEIPYMSLRQRLSQCVACRTID